MRETLIKAAAAIGVLVVFYWLYRKLGAGCSCSGHGAGGLPAPAATGFGSVPSANKRGCGPFACGR